MRSFLFRYRGSVMAAAFLVALGTAGLAAKKGIYWKMLLGANAPDWLLPIPLWQDGAGAQQLALLLSGVACLIAFLIRTAAEARLRTDVYTQGKSGQLIDGGPFAWLRNPLYLGTWLFFSAAVVWWVPLPLWGLLTLLFFFLVDGMVRYEETILVTQFGGAYRDYLARVRRWIPWPPARRAEARPPLGIYGWAALGNLGFASLGVFRIVWGAGAPEAVVGLVGLVNLVCMLVWVVVIIGRRTSTSSQASPPARQPEK
jgi:protein-S-isoprenylcysteine O-methyltransferase Ste14